MFRSIVVLFSLFGSAVAFKPLRAPRTRLVAARSHFSTVQTQLKDKELLKSSLEDLGLKVGHPEERRRARGAVSGLSESGSPSQVNVGTNQEVRGYQGETVLAEMTIAQANGQDIGFRFNGQA